MYWGAYSDLSHSDSLEVEPITNFGDGFTQVMNDIWREGGKGYALPSSLQPWGECHEEYLKARKQEDKMRDGG